MLTLEERRERINRIRRFPSELEVAVKDLTEEQLMTEFIHGEWTVAQNVHHVADSHMNAFIRTKLLLTEANPTIRPYDQDKFAERVDSFDAPIQYSILLLRGLHHRWVALFESLSEAEWARPGVHPESGSITVESILITYSDHGAGHLDQISRTLAAGKMLNLK
ncbi:MAG: putative metal-dependent hydrolase [Anaerolineae bacterium]|nr:putative metal-dependent hydrolase [Anaerolineae bacterium]